MPDPSGWTLDTLREHLVMVIDANNKRYEERFQSAQKAVDAALAAADRAVIKAETAAEKRFEGVNEFRNTLGDQQRNLIPRSEVDVLMRGQTDRTNALAGALTDKIDALEKQVEHLVSERAGIKGGYGYAVGVAGLVLTLGSIIALAVGLGR
jgi:hypothetical protein